MANDFEVVAEPTVGEMGMAENCAFIPDAMLGDEGGGVKRGASNLLSQVLQTWGGATSNTQCRVAVSLQRCSPVAPQPIQTSSRAGWIADTIVVSVDLCWPRRRVLIYDTSSGQRNACSPNKLMATIGRDGLPINNNFTKERIARVIAEDIDAAHARLGCGQLSARAQAFYLFD